MAPPGRPNMTSTCCISRLLMRACAPVSSIGCSLVGDGRFVGGRSDGSVVGQMWRDMKTTSHLGGRKAHTAKERRVRYETSTRLSASRDGLVHIVRTLCHGRGHDGKPPRFGRGAPALSVTVLWTTQRGSRNRSGALRDCHIIPRWSPPSTMSGSTGLIRGRPLARRVPTSTRPSLSNRPSARSANDGSPSRNALHPAMAFGPGLRAVSYTHLTLPTKRIV